jgi:hypothetical protein
MKDLQTISSPHTGCTMMGATSICGKITMIAFAISPRQERYRRPIIFYRYGIPEDMYDRHTYQKAGQVLRMLHDYLGDEPWWQGVRLWLERHAFDAVDIFDFKVHLKMPAAWNCTPSSSSGF